MIAFVCAVFLSMAGQANVWLNTTPLQGSSRNCILADAYGFAVGYEQSMHYRRLAWQHSACDEIYQTVLNANGSAKARQWREETYWRYCCWSALEDALDLNLSPAFRLHQLESLYELLGEDAYLQRAMPTPTPSYRIPLRD